MPIDPAIALQVKPAQIENPLDSLAKVLQVRQAMAQQALIPGQIAAQQQNLQAGQQQIQATQLENQTRQNQLDEYNGFKAALQKNNGDFDATIKNDSGSFPTLAPKLQETRVNINKTLADTAKLKADADEATHKLVTAKLSEVDQALQGLNAVPPEQRPAQFQAIKAQLTATGHDVTSLGDNYDPQQVANVHAQILDATQKVAEAKEARDAANAQATADKLKADALTAQQKAAGKEPIQPADAAKLAAEAATRAETGRHNTVEEKQGAQRVGVEGAQLRVRQAEVDPYGILGVNPRPIAGAAAGGQELHGEDYLATLPPPLRDKIRAMSTGAIGAPSASVRSPQAQQERTMLLQYDPGFTDQRAQIRKAFTTGADGRNIGALNTAAVHLDQFADAASAMNNGSFRPGNAAFNALSNAFGSAAPTNFESIKAAVSSEMASALKGNATDQEINGIKATIDKSASPQQLAGAIKTNLDILGAKLNTYQERYKQQSPDDTTWSPVLPSAKAVFGKHGINPTAGPGGGGGGQAAQGGYKPGDTRTINGVKYLRDANGTWNPQQ